MEKKFIGLLFIAILFLFSVSYMVYLITKPKHTPEYYTEYYIVEDFDDKKGEC